MRAAALTAAAADARSLTGRSGADEAQQADGFDAALADVAQTGSSAASTKAGATTAPPLSAALPGAGQTMAALLAKLTNGVTSTSADSRSPTSGLASGGNSALKSDVGAASAKLDKAGDEAAEDTAPVATDATATTGVLLPGLVAMPVVATGTPTATAGSEPTKTSTSLGETSVAKAIDLPGPGVDAESEVAAAPAVGLTLVASATHLAPAAPMAAQVGAQPAGAATKDEAKAASHVSSGEATALPSPTKSPPEDVTPTAAVASHGKPEAGLPEGTIPALATTITSLASGAASASTDVSQASAAGRTDPPPASVAPTRSLTLQLTPGDLGSVTVRLHLTAEGLGVDLAIGDRKTLASITHARDALASAIGDNGYRVDSLVIRGADASSTSTAGSHDFASSDSEAGAGQAFSNGASGGGSKDDAPGSRQRQPQASGLREPGRDRSGDGVFV